MKLSSLSILIPAYNDEHTIETVIRQARIAGKKHTNKYEILVIDDASPDALGNVLEKMKKRYSELRVITHIKNLGYGGTLKDLYTSGYHTWLFTVPGDYQIEPLELTKLIPYTTHADMIIGRRVARQDNWKRKIQSAIYNGLLRFLFGVKLHDINSVRLMKRAIIQNNTLRGSSAFIDAKMTIQAINSDYRVIEVPIEHRMRKTGGAGGGKLSLILPVIWEMLKYRMELWL